VLLRKITDVYRKTDISNMMFILMYFVQIAVCCVGLDTFCFAWNSERFSGKCATEEISRLMNEVNGVNGVKAVSVG